MKRKLIKTINVDKANFEHIAKTGNVNGTLLIEIERVMEEYTKGKVELLEALKRLKAACPETQLPMGGADPYKELRRAIKQADEAIKKQ